MVQAALVSWVPESVLFELLQDPRVAQMYPLLWQTLAKNMLWLVNLPTHVWEALAPLTELTASELQSGCIAAGHIAFHFFWRRS